MRPKELPYTPQTDYNLVIYALRLGVQLWPLWIAPFVYQTALGLWLASGTGLIRVLATPFAAIIGVSLLVPVALILKRLRLSSWNSVDAATLCVVLTLAYSLFQSIGVLPHDIKALFSAPYRPLVIQTAGLGALAVLIIGSMLRLPAPEWFRLMTESHEGHGDDTPAIKGVVVAPDDASLRDISPAALEAAINTRVIGQDVIARQTSKSIARRLAQRRRGKPVFTGLFAGPTGVGKTELAKTVAEALFKSDQALFRVDCGNVMGEAGLQTLVGAPTGYMGSDKPGALTAHVQRFPNSVLLFDEIEKAGSAGTQSPLFRLLLSILDEGRFTEQSNGQAIDASGCVILMTSNAAHDALNAIYKRHSGDATELTRATKDELRSHFSPEFLARIDLVTCFSPLDAQARGKIIAKQIARLASQYDVTVASIDARIISKGLAQWQSLERYGAREVARWIEDVTADSLIDAKKRKITRVDLVMDGDAVVAKPAV